MNKETKHHTINIINFIFVVIYFLFLINNLIYFKYFLIKKQINYYYVIFTAWKFKH